MVTVPVEDVPPVTCVGFRLRPTRTGGLIVRIAVSTTVPEVAVIVAGTDVETGTVFMVNVAVVAFAGMVTEVGTVAEPELLVNCIDTPAPGADELIVTVPVEDVPPTRVVGLRVSETKDGGLIVSDAVCTTPAKVALTVAVTELETGIVLTRNVAEVAFAGTVMELGTAAELGLADNDTVIPPDGAGPSRLMVPVEDDPPVTVVGFKLSDTSIGALTVRVAV